ncbi:MAG: NAD-dependent epimerase/dehydratase family protein [Candidatus Nanopelagicales bacterium]
MIVAVTGADGFIGTHLCEALERGGFSVHRLQRASSLQAPALDLAAPVADWQAALDGSDVVVNLAGLAHDVRGQTPEQVDEYLAVNAHGAARVASAAASIGAQRFIQISTIKVLGETPRDGIRFREGDPLAPVGVYAVSKARGEELIRSQLAGRTDCVVVRLPLVFGTPFKGNLAVLEKAIRRGIPLPLGHSSIGARTYVQMGELTDLILKVIRHSEPLPPILHARSTPDLTAAEVARLVGREIGRQPRIVSVPSSALKRLAKAAGKPELASKICDSMLVSDDETRQALGI